MPSIAPIPIRIRRDRAWLKVDGGLDFAIFERKCKAVYHVYDVADALDLSASKRRCLESSICEQAELLMSISTFVKPSSAPIKTDTVEEIMPVTTIVETQPVLIKSEAVETKSAIIVSTTDATTHIAQPTIKGRPMIKCRVTGYPRLRQKMDDFEAMWDAKDEARWDSWCEKSREERGPVRGYEDGDSDCEWSDFKERRRLRMGGAAKIKAFVKSRSCTTLTVLMCS